MRPTLSTIEVAKLLGTSEQHIRKLARERHLAHYRIGALYKFDPAEVEAYLQRARVGSDDGEAA